MSLRLGHAVANGHDNNLNLVRMVAALAVLVSHSFAIVSGNPAREPLQAALGMSLGGIAVWAFFAISGFLVAKSWERAAGSVDFLLARALRIGPGLIVVLLLTVLLLGPAFTHLGLRAYFGETAVFTYIPRNFTLVSMQYPLPGVFDGNPFGPAINGSLWTLFHEVACYLMLLIVGLVGGFRTRWVWGAFLGTFGAFWLAMTLAYPAAGKASLFADLALPFVAGMCLYRARRRVPLAAGIILLLATAACLAHGTVAFKPVFAAALAYAVLWLAYRPGGVLRAYNQLGDCSFGVYIYAFPVQQALVALEPGIPIPMHIALASLVVLPLAAASWILVEKPMLGLRRPLAELWRANAASMRGRDRTAA
ncbi:acyltransferase family protein [Methylobacterium sp. A54F]